jgi:hypothetical protein
MAGPITLNLLTVCLFLRFVAVVDCWVHVAYAAIMNRSVVQCDQLSKPEYFGVAEFDIQPAGPDSDLRAVFGAHHSISEAHLHRYLTEWDYKWNTRKMTDGERAAVALKGAEGKRLTYRQPREASHA